MDGWMNLSEAVMVEGGDSGFGGHFGGGFGGRRGLLEVLAVV